jgi:hypothetical protein
MRVHSQSKSDGKEAFLAGHVLFCSTSLDPLKFRMKVSRILTSARCPLVGFVALHCLTLLGSKAFRECRY